MERDEAEVPECRTGGQCRVPRLTAENARLLRARETLIALRDMVDASSVFEMYGLDLDDLELLARAEMEFMDQRRTDGLADE